MRSLPPLAKERATRVFLADGDALALAPRRLCEILDLLHEELPSLERVASYANAKNLLAKSVDDLAALRERGLTLLYLGLESGDDETLAAIHKGMTVAEQIAGCARASAAGVRLSVTAILGLAGAARSLVHAAATGEALSAIDPAYIGLLTLMLVPGTAMHHRVATGELVLPDAFGMLRELREILAHIDVDRRPLPFEPRLELPPGGRAAAGRQGRDARAARSRPRGARGRPPPPRDLARPVGRRRRGPPSAGRSPRPGHARRTRRVDLAAADRRRPSRHPTEHREPRARLQCRLLRLHAAHHARRSAGQGGARRRCGSCAGLGPALRVPAAPAGRRLGGAGPAGGVRAERRAAVLLQPVHGRVHPGPGA